MDTQELLAAMAIPLLILTIILGVWVVGIYKAFPFPDGRKILRSVVLKTVTIGGIISVLLGSYFYSSSTAFYLADLGWYLGLIIGGAGTFVIAGFVLLSKINKAFRLYKEGDQYAASLTKSDILDDL
ncbi:MAG: hypothetical protein ACRBFS_18460 [Aureispira sp.]